MPSVTDPFGFGDRYDSATNEFKQASYNEAPSAPTPVAVPMPPVMGTTPPSPSMPDLKMPTPGSIPVALPNPMIPTMPDVKPVAAPMMPAPSAPVTPEPVKIADVAPPVVPKPTPVVTTPVVAAPATLMTPNGQPSAFQVVPPMPVAVTPTAPVPLPPAPSVSGLANIYPAPQSLGAQLTPPAAIRPVTNTEVRTAIDVDLHEPKRGDTYASISKMHYGDDRYAAAIQAFNQNRNLGDGAAIELPLTQYLRQNYRQYIGGTPPVSNDPARTPEWAPSAGRAVPTPRTFTVNREGMTMWDVAEDVYGDRQKWKQIQDANPQLDANERYRIGDRFRLPLDAPQTVKRVP